MGTQVASLYVKLTADISEYEKNMSKAASRFSKMGASLTKTGKSLMKSVTAPIIAAGAAILKMSSDFDQAMRNVNSVLLLNDVQFEKMYSDVLRFSMTTRAGAVEVANALLYVAQAGFRADEATALMTLSSRAAGAAFTEADSMARLLIASIRAYDLEVADAARVTDIFIYAMQSGAGSVSELSDAFSFVAPTAAMAGVSLEETVAALTVLHRGGLSTSQSVTALNNMLLKLIKPSEKLTNVFNAAGYESATAAIQVLGLSGTMQLLRQQTGGSVEQIAAMFPHIRALRGALMLTSGDATQLADALGNLQQNAQGAMESAREQQYKSLQSQLLLLKGTVEVLAITIGSVFLPTLVEWAEKYGPKLIFWVESLNGEAIKQIAIYVGIAAAIGPVLFLMGKLFVVIGFLVTVVKNAYTAFIVLKGAMIALASSTVVAAMLGNVAGAVGRLIVASGTGSLAVASLSASVGVLGTSLLAVLGPIAAIVAALFYLGKSVKEQIIDRFKKGAEDASGAWDDWLSDMEASGASATEIASEYGKAMDSMNASMNDFSGGPIEDVANLLVGAFGDVGVGADKLNETLSNTASSYDEYKEAAHNAGIAPTLIFSKKLWELGAAGRAAGASAESMADSISSYADIIGGAAEETLALNEAIAGDEQLQALLEAQAERLTAQLDLTAEAMDEVGLSAEYQSKMLDWLALKMGAATKESLKFRDETQLIAKAFAAGLIEMNMYAYLVDQVRMGTLDLKDSYVETLTAQLDMIATTEALNAKLAAQGQLFAGALGSDLANLIEQHSQLATVQASSVEEINDSTIAAFKATQAYGKWQEALQKQNENTDPDLMQELGAAVASAHNAYMGAAAGAGKLNDALTEGYSFTKDMSGEIRENLLGALFDQAKASEAPLEALVLLAAATGEWDEAQVAAALKAAALNEQITILGREIAEGLSIDDAIAALDDLWVKMNEAPADLAFEVKVELPEIPTMEDIMGDVRWDKEEDSPFAGMNQIVETSAGEMLVTVQTTIGSMNELLSGYPWAETGTAINNELATGFGEGGRGGIVTTSSQVVTDTQAFWTNGNWDTLGFSAAGGILAGWDAKFPSVRQEMISDMTSLMTQIAEAAKVKSPSKVTSFVGEMMAKGLGTGWEANISGIQDMFTNDITTLAPNANEVNNIDNSVSRAEEHYHLHVSDGVQPRESLMSEYNLMRASRVGGSR